MTDKSIADVLDQTINSLTSGIEGLSKAIQKIAPDAWSVLIHQQKLYGEKDLFVGLLWLISSIFFIAYTVKYTKIFYKKSVEIMDDNRRYSETGEGYLVLIGMMILFCVGNVVPAIYYINSGWLEINNPSYYAAQDLMEKVRVNEK
jgi:hypothetical protein